MTLAELIQFDNQNLFLELKDFAETHTLEGVEMDISVDNDRLDFLKAQGYSALIEADLMFFCRSDEIARHTPGSLINYDGRECTVVNWTENKGISCVAIAQRRKR